MESWDWKDHIALLVGSLSAFVVILRLMAIADFDPQTAYVILKSAGTASVLMGTAISSIGILALAGVTVVIYLKHQRPISSSAIVFYIPAFLLILVALSIPVWFLFLALVGWMVGHRAGGKAIERERLLSSGDLKESDQQAISRRVSRENRLMTVIMPTMIVVSTFLSTIFTSTPWLPLEKVDAGNTANVGYVLEVNPSAFVILKNNPRSVVYLDPRNTPIKRQICMPGGWFNSWRLARPLPRVFSAPVYPKCPQK